VQQYKSREAVREERDTFLKRRIRKVLRSGSEPEESKKRLD